MIFFVARARRAFSSWSDKTNKTMLTRSRKRRIDAVPVHVHLNLEQFSLCHKTLSNCAILGMQADAASKLGPKLQVFAPAIEASPLSCVAAGIHHLPRRCHHRTTMGARPDAVSHLRINIARLRQYEPHLSGGTNGDQEKIAKLISQVNSEDPVQDFLVTYRDESTKRLQWYDICASFHALTRDARAVAAARLYVEADISSSHPTCLLFLFRANASRYICVTASSCSPRCKSGSHVTWSQSSSTPLTTAAGRTICAKWRAHHGFTAPLPG